MLLELKNIRKYFPIRRDLFGKAAAYVKAVDGIDVTMRPGENISLVGESGCGNSVTSLSIMRLLPKPAGRIVSGSILYDGKDLATLPGEQMSQVSRNPKSGKWSV